VSVDGSGNVFVAGYTSEALPGQTHAGRADAFVRKYDSSGAELWTRQFGSSDADVAYSVSVDGSGNVFVAGYQQTSAAPSAFVRKYDSSGAELWAQQFGLMEARAVSVDGSGNVFVAGSTYGDTDAFVRKYDSSGAELWTRQFISDGFSSAYSVTVDGSGNAFIAGTARGDLGQSGGAYDEAFVRKYDSSGTEVWTQQFGSRVDDRANSVSVDGSGNVVVAGITAGTVPGQTSAGLTDGILRKYDSSGAEVWTEQFGSISDDFVHSVSVDGNGAVFVAGSGRLPDSEGDGNAFLVNAFVRKLAE
jgi:hypothetical protein